MFSSDTLILIVDDMKTMRKIVQKSCKDLGFSNFVEAEDGAQAWTLLSSPESKIGLVISDWNMPNSTGLDLLIRVRASEMHKKMPFLLLTAESESSQVQTAVQAGVDNYLVKPFNTDTLKDKIAAIYKKRFAA